MDDNSAIIPLFPLSTVVLPGEQIPLHIFEERYREMIAECRKGDIHGNMLPFGLSLADKHGLKDVGCLLSIARVMEEYSDGRLDIMTQGERRYRLQELYRDRSSYYQALVQFFDDEEGSYAEAVLVEEAIQLHKKLVKQVKGEEPELELEGVPSISFYLARHAGLRAEQKQELLEMCHESERLHQLIRFYQSALRSLDKNDEISRRIRANGYLRRLHGIEI